MAHFSPRSAIFPWAINHKVLARFQGRLLVATLDHRRRRWNARKINAIHLAGTVGPRWWRGGANERNPIIARLTNHERFTGDTSMCGTRVLLHTVRPEKLIPAGRTLITAKHGPLMMVSAVTERHHLFGHIGREIGPSVWQIVLGVFWCRNSTFVWLLLNCVWSWNSYISWG